MPSGHTSAPDKSYFLVSRINFSVFPPPISCLTAVPRVLGARVKIALQVPILVLLILIFGRFP